MNRPRTSFRLELSTNQSWNITAEDPVRAWAERLAGILQLPRGEIQGSPRLIFKKKGAQMEPVPAGDWKSLHLMEMVVRSQTQGAEVICEVQSESPDLMGIWESVYPIYCRALHCGGLPIHAGLIERNGEGVLLGGISNSGKTTCCRRIPLPWRVLCDEESLILLDRERETYTVHPFPTWSLLGELKAAPSWPSWDVRSTAPLRAVFFIEKSDGDAVEALGRGVTAMKIFSLADEKCHLNWDGISRKERVSHRERLFENACRMAEAVPGYILRVSRSGRFWTKLDEALAHG